MTHKLTPKSREERQRKIPWSHRSISRTQNAEPNSSWTYQSSSQGVPGNESQTHPPQPRHSYSPHQHCCCWASASSPWASQWPSQGWACGTSSGTWSHWCTSVSVPLTRRRWGVPWRGAWWGPSNGGIEGVVTGTRPRKPVTGRWRKSGTACGAPSFGGLWHASSQGSSRSGAGWWCSMLGMLSLLGHLVDGFHSQPLVHRTDRVIRLSLSQDNKKNVGSLLAVVIAYQIQKYKG